MTARSCRAKALAKESASLGSRASPANELGDLGQVSYYPSLSEPRFTHMFNASQGGWDQIMGKSPL